ncbi:hypothetical protein GYD59_001948 [Salmonella enterica]|nr:hypothetical protein [Salmonella enterica]EEH2567247.1 hypothetical protein [Salmonella enterica]
MKDIRQKRLKEWFADKKLPPKDASFISQVIGGKFIGERAARRLENDHGMPALYLDTPFENDVDGLTLPREKENGDGAAYTGGYAEKLKRAEGMLLSLPDDDAEEILGDFLSALKSRTEFYERKYAEWLHKNKLKDI